MPILEDDDLDDRALLWEASGHDAAGQPVWDEPEEIFVDYRIKRKVVFGGDGSELVLDAQATVQRRIAVDSRMWFAPDHTTSALTQWYASGSAGQADEVFRVVHQGETRDTKKIETRYTVGLVWDRDE